MKLLKKIPTEKICAIDVETVRIAETFEELSEDFQSAWEYKNKQDGEVPDTETLSDLWERNSALYAEFAKVCAVSLAFLDAKGEKLMMKEFFGENEEQLLMDLSEYLERIYLKGEYRLAAHAGKYFDYPFLCKRFVINGLDIPNILDTNHLKPWENPNICTNQDIWKMGGTGAGSSLQALCTALQIPASKADMVGDAVGAAYYNREFERIARYCSHDTIAVFNIIRKIKKEPIFQFDEVVYLEDTKEQLTILQKLYTTKSFNEEIKEYLKAQKIAKKDKPTVQKIVLAHYKEQIDVMNRNKKELEDINKEREKEIKAFFKTL
jgi:DNA polymerase III epsilon subunit-like protein